MCAGKNGARAALEEGAHTVVVEMLRNGNTQGGLHIAIAATLRNLTAHCDPMQLIKESCDLLQTLVNTLRSFEGDDGVEEAVVCSLANLSCEIEVVKHMISSKAHSSLLQLVRRPASHLVCAQAWQALQHMSLQAPAPQAIHDAAGFPVIVQVLEQESSCDEILQCVCAMVGNIVGTSPSLRDVFVSLGGPTATLKVLKRSRSFELTWHALVAVAHFITAEGARVELLLEGGVAAALIEAMRSYYDCHELQMVGLHAVPALAGQVKGARSLTSAGAHTALVAVMGANRDKPDIQSNVCAVPENKLDAHCMVDI